MGGAVAFAARVVGDVTPRMVVGDPALLSPMGAAELALTFPEFQAFLQAIEPLFTVDAAVTDQSPLQIIFHPRERPLSPKESSTLTETSSPALGRIEREMQKYLKYERLSAHPLRFLHSLPLSHVFGQFMGLWVPALLGAEVHFESQLDPTRLIATIHRERIISVLAAVPRAAGAAQSSFPHQISHSSRRTRRRTRRIRDGKHCGWRFRKVHSALGFKFWAIVCGGASLPQELEEFWNILGFALIQGYGLTETAALVTLNHPFKIGKGTIGKPLPGREVRIGENGEILVRGEMLSTTTWQAGPTPASATRNGSTPAIWPRRMPRASFASSAAKAT